MSTGFNLPIGHANDEATTPGASGSLNAKMRLMTTQLDTMASRAVVLNIPASGINVDLVFPLPLPVSGTISISSFPAVQAISGTVTLVAPASGISVAPIPSSTLLAGTLTTSTVAAPLSGALACVEVMVQNDPDSTADVLLGSSTVQVIQLLPGDAIVIAINDVSKVYVKSVSGSPVVNWLARS